MDKILLYDKHGDSWSFFRNLKGELCYMKNNSKLQKILENVAEDFELITDERGNIHLMAQTETGSLVYLRFDFENWKKYVILDSKSASNSMRNFKAFIVDGKIHCFYILSFKGKFMLVHHIFSDYDQSGVPNVISYTSANKNFSAVTDLEGNIHIFFFDENSAFKYKIYKSAYNDGIFPTEDNVNEICSLCDDQGVIHLLYTARLKSYHTLIYFNLLSKERKIISFGDSPLKDCSLKITKDIVSIQWREHARHYECLSKDNGGNFKKPSILNSSLSPVRLRSAFNPLCLNEDRFFQSEKFIYKPVPNHKNTKTDYTVIDGNFTDRLKKINDKLAENEKEILRLNTVIKSLSEKLRYIEKSFSKPPEKETAPKTENPPSPNQINEENYEIFNNTDIENMNFENSQIF